jgi:hypothetical protein
MFRIEELPKAAIDNYIDMAWVLTPVRKKNLDRELRRPASCIFHYVQMVRDHVTGVIIRQADPDILLIPVIASRMKLSTKQARDTLVITWHNMGEYGKRTAIFNELGNVFVGCSRRIRYSGLRRSEAIEATLKAIPEIPAEEDWAMLGDYLSVQTGPIG